MNCCSNLSEQESISVVIRVRPLIQQEKQQKSEIGQKINNQSNEISLLQDYTSTTFSYKYTFDKIFDSKADTKSVYNFAAKDIIYSTIDGKNGTIFAYGQTSSGKTFTMRGLANLDDFGIIPLAIYDIFEQIRTKFQDRIFLLRVSYIEIYQEMIKDLLSPKSEELKIFQNIHGATFVDSLTKKTVNSEYDILSKFDEGEKNRHYGSTYMNSESSRSHTIFQIHIESRIANSEDHAIRSSTLNLVDLAGSERQSLTGSEGIRLKEGGHINKSLLTLERVIKNLSEDNASHVPYRDSKLTRILQPALGGNSRTLIICTVSPANKYIEETKSTLEFACRAKAVKNRVTVNEMIDDTTKIYRLNIRVKELEQLLVKYQPGEQVIKCLKEELDKVRSDLIESRKQHFENLQYLNTPTAFQNLNSKRRRATFCAIREEEKFGCLQEQEAFEKKSLNKLKDDEKELELVKYKRKKPKSSETLINSASNIGFTNVKPQHTVFNDSECSKSEITKMKQLIEDYRSQIFYLEKFKNEYNIQSKSTTLSPLEEDFRNLETLFLHSSSSIGIENRLKLSENASQRLKDLFGGIKSVFYDHEEHLKSKFEIEKLNSFTNSEKLNEQIKRLKDENFKLNQQLQIVKNQKESLKDLDRRRRQSMIPPKSLDLKLEIIKRQNLEAENKELKEYIENIKLRKSLDKEKADSEVSNAINISKTSTDLPTTSSNKLSTPNLSSKIFEKKLQLFEKSNERLKSKLNECEGRLKDSQNENIRFETKLAQKERDFDKLKRQLDLIQRDSHIQKTNRSQAVEYKNQIEILNKKCDLLTKKNERLENGISERRQDVKIKEEKIGKLEEEIVFQRKKHVEDLEFKKEAFDAKLKRLEDEKQKEIENLSLKVENMQETLERKSLETENESKEHKDSILKLNNDKCQIQKSLEVLTFENEKFKQEISKFTNELNLSTNKMEELRKIITEKEKLILELQENLEQFKMRQNVEDVCGNVEDLQKQEKDVKKHKVYKELQTHSEHLKQELEKQVENNLQLKNKFDICQAEKQEIQKEQLKAEAQIESQTSPNTHSEKIENLQRSLAELEIERNNLNKTIELKQIEFKQKNDELNGKLKTLTKELGEKQSFEEAAKVEIQHLNTELKILQLEREKEKVTSIGKNDVQIKIKDLKEKLQTSEKKFVEAKKKFERLKKGFLEYKRKYEDNLNELKEKYNEKKRIMNHYMEHYDILDKSSDVLTNKNKELEQKCSILKKEKEDLYKINQDEKMASVRDEKHIKILENTCIFLTKQFDKLIKDCVEKQFCTDNIFCTIKQLREFRFKIQKYVLILFFDSNYIQNLKFFIVKPLEMSNNTQNNSQSILETLVSRLKHFYESNRPLYSIKLNTNEQFQEIFSSSKNFEQFLDSFRKSYEAFELCNNFYEDAIFAIFSKTNPQQQKELKIKHIDNSEQQKYPQIEANLRKLSSKLNNKESFDLLFTNGKELNDSDKEN